MPQPTESWEEGATFNVISMAGSTERLLPFALSLLQSPRVRVRLVANACDRSEVDLMAAAAAGDERVTHHVLPSEHPVEHGLALNHLFQEFEEPHFAFIDSDVFASGDFLGALLPLGPGRAGTFTAPPVWVADEETRLAPRARVLSGRRRTLHDGTAVGSTYCAVYDRALLEPAWRQAPRGFAVHHTHMIPRATRKELAALGWRFHTLDTARLINLRLLASGLELEHRLVPELHHVGGLSVRSFEGAGGVLRSMRALLRSGSGGRLQRAANGAMTRLYAKTQHDPVRRVRKRRRQLVVSYLDGALDAIAAGAPVPPPPKTDSAEVDRRLAALVEALEVQYPRGLAALRELTVDRSSSLAAP